MLESKISWPVEELADSVNTGFVRLDHKIQRGDVWTPQQRSLLIHSAFAGYPIHSLYMIREEGQYWVIEGRQRSRSFASFLNNEFKLVKGTPPFKLKSGDIYNAEGQAWEELPEEIKTKVRIRIVDIVNISEASTEEINELFYRLNNNTKLKPIHKTVARTKSIEQMNLLCNHEIFTRFLEPQLINGSHHKELAFKSWISINQKDVGLTQGKIEQIMNTAEITDESILESWDLYDYLLNVFDVVIQENGADAGKKIIDNIIKNTTNFPCLTIVAKESVKDNIPASVFSKWVTTFFPAEIDTNGLSANVEYNATGKGNGITNVKTRHGIILGHYNAFKNNTAVA